jgi:hypothetical protein
MNLLFTRNAATRPCFPRKLDDVVACVRRPSLLHCIWFGARQVIARTLSHITHFPPQPLLLYSGMRCSQCRPPGVGCTFAEKPLLSHLVALQIVPHRHGFAAWLNAHARKHTNTPNHKHKHTYTHTHTHTRTHSTHTHHQEFETEH